MALFNKKYSELTDEALMLLVTKGESKAYAEIYDRYSAKMLNYFYRMLWKDKEKSMDFMQELFTHIIEKPGLFSTERSFKTWLYSCANNMCKNEYKKQEKRQDYYHTPIENTADPVVQPDYLMHDRKHFNKKLNQELDKLDDAHKSTFLLRFKEDCTMAEISKILNCSEGTVKSRIFYTLKKLSKQLQIYNPNPTEVCNEK